MKSEQPKQDTSLPSSARVSGVFAASSVRSAAVSLLAILPCFWQSRIQAGDLSSHIYNAWLAEFILAHKPKGLAVVSQSTNVLFDELLSLLMAAFGANLAQRFGTALCVLVFFWGAFRFIGSFERKQPWPVVPLLLILAYGWTFQMGLLNFYLSLGICFWALPWALRFRPAPAFFALLLGAVAWRAHNLPVIWSLGVVTWAWAATRLPKKKLLRLGIAGGAVVALLSVWLRFRFPTQWSVEQLSGMTGADQAWIFDFKYYGIFAGILFYWVSQVVDRTRLRPVAVDFGKLPLQVVALTAFTVGVMPSAILLPGYSHGLVYIAERMSLAIGVVVLAWLADAPVPRLRAAVATALALVFFGMMYRDWAALNRLEDRVSAAVANGVSRSARVVTAIKIPASRIPASLHMVDRACLGWCFSYSNYEPSTGQFRVRATAPNAYVTHDYQQAYDMQTGNYQATTADGPLYELIFRPSGDTVSLLPAGQTQTVSEVPLF